MRHKTNSDLIEEQINFWNEDFADPSDPVKISLDPEEVSLKDLSYNEAIAEGYSDPENRERIESLKKALLSGVFLPPLLTDKNYHVIDGIHRLIALKEIGENKALIIKLNKKFNDTETPIF